MRTAKSIVQVSLILVIAGWTARSSRGDDASDRAAGGDDHRICREKRAALGPEFDKAVSEKNSCKSSSECAVLTPGCPFGCYVGVRRADLAAVQARVQELSSTLGADCTCKYRCPTQPAVSC